MPSVAGKRGHCNCIRWDFEDIFNYVVWAYALNSKLLMALFCNSSPWLVLKAGEGRHYIYIYIYDFFAPKLRSNIWVRILEIEWWTNIRWTTVSRKGWAVESKELLSHKAEMSQHWYLKICTLKQSLLVVVLRLKLLNGGVRGSERFLKACRLLFGWHQSWAKNHRFLTYNFSIIAIHLQFSWNSLRTTQTCKQHPSNSRGNSCHRRLAPLLWRWRP